MLCAKWIGLKAIPKVHEATILVIETDNYEFFKRALHYRR